MEPQVGSIARAARVLSALGDYPEGASLSELIARTGFSKTTTHRVLASLQEVHYVAQDPESRGYRIGHELALLSRRAEQNDMSELSRRGARRLADETGDTIFVAVPEGAASICVRRELGAFPIRTLTIAPGDRTPLGVGASAQALYAAMPKAKRMAAARANAGWMRDYNFTPELAEERAADAARRGYALNDSRVIQGMSAVGLPVITTSGRLVAGIGIGAINDRMSLRRIEGELVPLMREEVARLVARLDILEAEGLF